jgi:hypothetical protein
MNSGTRKSTFVGVVALGILAIAGVVVWDKIFRSVPQPASITVTQRDDFLYGSIGGEESAGIPYWIWLALPRIFPEYLPGPGGYASLGFSWEETSEMPAGFSKKTVGYVRVAGNCALCHAYSLSNGPDAAPTVFAAGPGHTEQVRTLLTFYKRCAQDPRFNAANILDEVSMATKLSLIDRTIYRYILIPRTRQRLLSQDSVMVDQALWRHSQNPQLDPDLRQRMQSLETDLQGPEKDALDKYLKSLP